MERYNNGGRSTGAVAYQIVNDGIEVKFQDDSVYLYTKEATGADNVEKMRKLAAEGRGLTSFINREVKKRYAKKLR